MRLYLDRLNEWAGDEPESHLVTPSEAELPVFTFTYRGQFGENTISGFTYGLSLVRHPDWRLGSPELFISMDSENLNWTLAAGYVATAWRGEKRYSAGDAFDLGDPISPDESEMSVLLLFLATDLDPEFTRVELPDRVINIVQLYPMYESEMPLLEEKGPAEFLSTEDVNFHDPRRRPLS
ncbi:suppressor of fused domain protein [Actinoallomurus sp. CA-150999]|uniref:suppressor of fused domain protein n=1 Tax=Actinoallomurus sp. CA-150999 TaxID=3239887 RepID=UPI003D8E020F